MRWCGSMAGLRGAARLSLLLAASDPCSWALGRDPRGGAPDPWSCFVPAASSPSARLSGRRAVARRAASASDAGEESEEESDEESDDDGFEDFNMFSDDDLEDLEEMVVEASEAWVDQHLETEAGRKIGRSVFMADLAELESEATRGVEDLKAHLGEVSTTDPEKLGDATIDGVFLWANFLGALEGAWLSADAWPSSIMLGATVPGMSLNKAFGAESSNSIISDCFVAYFYERERARHNQRTRTNSRHVMHVTRGTDPARP